MLTNWFAFLLHKFLKVIWHLFSLLIATGVKVIDDNAPLKSISIDLEREVPCMFLL